MYFYYKLYLSLQILIFYYFTIWVWILYKVEYGGNGRYYVLRPGINLVVMFPNNTQGLCVFLTTYQPAALPQFNCEGW